jgi:hypothetical protein
VSITISVSKTYRDQLRTLAARRNLHDPDQLTSASTIAREIICEYIDRIECLEADFQATDAIPSHERVDGQIEESVIEK